MPAVIVLKSGLEIAVEESADEVLKRCIVPDNLTADKMLASFYIDREKDGTTIGRRAHIVVSVIAAVIDHPRRPRI